VLSYPQSTMTPFDRTNLSLLDLADIRAHGGEGLIRFARIAERDDLASGCNFIDLAELPPGTSVGLHTHGQSEEEFYLVLAGSGEMTRNGQVFRVEAGDLIRNPPGGTHSLRNTGAESLKIFVFELEVRS
jgi:mannose-6-phosphate isomerase-like protein (cupin superfamily)